jgi:ABC-2 type transport system permease protein
MTADSTQPSAIPADTEPVWDSGTPAPQAAPERHRRDGAIPSRRERSVPRAGWMVVAGKEFADHLWSARFIVLLVVLGVAALIPMYFAADTIRASASQATGTSSLFLFLFTLSPQVGTTGVQIPSALEFIRIVGPLLGVVFAFDAVNGERSDGTLPRLLSQPIYRDDVINGKFAAGLAVIGLVLTFTVGVIAAFGIIRLGIAPGAEDLLRITFWLIVTFVYIALWLSFGLLLSVLIRSAATSALIGFGTSLLLTIFGGLITGIINGIVAPATGSLDQQAAAYSLQQTITRLLPDTIYREAAFTILNPQVASITNPATVTGYQQLAQQIPSLQSFQASLLLVWPHIVTMTAIAIVFFAIAYVRFMRQEVRA